MRIEKSLTLTCPNEHKWNTKIVGIDWQGAVYAQAFCPHCTLKGFREPLHAADFDNAITEAKLDEIGHEAHPVLGVLMSALMAQEEPGKPRVLDTLGIASYACEDINRTRDFIKRLERAGLIRRDPVETKLGYHLDDVGLYAVGSEVKLPHPPPAE